MKITKGLIATIIIFMISGLAFTAGYLKENANSDIEETSETIVENEILIDKIKTKIDDILSSDLNYFIKALDLSQNAFMLANELEILNDTLTVEEREVYFKNIEQNLIGYMFFTRMSLMGTITHYFSTGLYDPVYYLAEEQVDGFNYTVSEESFFAINASHGLADLLLPTELMSRMSIGMYIFTHISLPPDYFLEIHTLDNWAAFYRLELSELQEELAISEQQLLDLKNKTSFYDYGVTIITVATILATALAAQVTEKERKKDFSHIEAEIYDDNSKIIKRTKQWPLILLFIAFLFSILGLILPIILF